MTDDQTRILIQTKREEFRDRKKEKSVLLGKASELAGFAEKISEALAQPQMIRWFDGLPSIGRGPQHKVLTEKMFEDLNPQFIEQMRKDLNRLEAVLGALRQELTAMDEDPGAF